MPKWKNVLLNKNSKIAEAIKVLDKEEPKIVLITDKKYKLIGTITDGDIRRAILKGITFDSPVTKAMQKNFKSLLFGTKKEIIKQKMERFDLKQMPLVNKDMILKGLETIESFNFIKRYKNPVFIMAGGYGKRLKPLTHNTPKPLLKIGSKPILERIIESFIYAGFENFFISTHYQAKLIKDYFGNGP